MIIGNLRTMTKFTTTMSLGWEKTGTRTSVWVGKRKLKMQSVGRSTTMTTLNVNTNVKLWCTKFFAMASFKTMQDLICLSCTSNFIDHEEFFVLSDLFEWKNLLSVRRLFSFNWMRWPSPSVCQSLDLEKKTCWCESHFPYKVYFLDIKHIWFALPEYVQINLSLTSSLSRPSQLLSFFEVKTIHQLNFQSTPLDRRKRNDTLIYEDEKMQRTSKIA